jgi:hypothetical protein
MKNEQQKKQLEVEESEFQMNMTTSSAKNGSKLINLAT